MAKNKKTAGDSTPSADEIIEALALEMGVDSQKDGAEIEPGVVEAAEAVKPGPVEAPAPSKAPAAKKAADPMAGLGGIFEVPTNEGDKKAKAPRKPEREGSPSSAGVEAIDALFNVSGSPAPVDLSDASSSGLDAGDEDQELARMERKVGGGANRALIAVVVVMAIGLLVMGLVAFGGKGVVDDVGAVMSGTYRDKKDSEKRRQEEEWRKQQLEQMEKYGSLNITGEPNYASIKLQLEGEPEPRTVFAQTTSGLWRDLSTPTIIHNLKVKKPINIRIEAPGYKTHVETLTENMWQETPTGEYQYSMSRYLVPENEAVRAELEDRMLEFDENLEINGIIHVDSKPPGAKIKLNNRLVVDKDGNPILTKADGPVVLSAQMVDPEDKKKEALPLKINTPPDNGYKIDVFFDGEGEPKYVAVVQRNLWTCNQKEENELKRLGADARPVLKCDYSYRVLADFEGIKTEIRRLEAIEEEMRKQKEEMERLQKEAEAASKG